MKVNFTLTISSTNQILDNYLFKNITTTPINEIKIFQQINKNFSLQTAALYYTTTSNQLNDKQQPYLLNILELWATISYSLWFN